jgi:hypothetical protein
VKHLYNGKVIIESGTLIRGRGCRAAASKGSLNPQKPKFKNNTSVEKKVSNVLFDLPFRRNHRQNSADDRYIRI